MIDLRNLKNIILDLGNVILEIYLDKTIRSFREFGFPEIEELDIVFARYSFFREFELGLISSEQFVSEIRRVTGNHLSDESVLAAWNSMIGGFIEGTIPLLQKLNKKYRMFLLSNTNRIHEIEYNHRLMTDHGIPDLTGIFEKVYYSHDLHLSKPDPMIFRYVLNENRLVPEETLFVDDVLVHIESASRLGIRTFHLRSPLKLTEVLVC